MCFTHLCRYSYTVSTDVMTGVQDANLAHLLTAVGKSGFYSARVVESTVRSRLSAPVLISVPANWTLDEK